MVKADIQISFIVPFYNVEKYIAACLDSIYNQDIPESAYEVICVDDCSPDNSRAIVEDYQKLHTNLKLIIHSENKCLGGARNTGIRNARGKYVWFIDSDDTIKANSLGNLVDKCKAEDLDVLMFNYDRIDEVGNFIDTHIVFPDALPMSGVEYVHHYFRDQFIHNMGYVWRNLYKFDYLRVKELYFPEQVFWEDTAYMPRALLLSQRISSVSDSIYQYRMNTDSISGEKNKYNADRFFQYAFCAGKDLLDFSNEINQLDEGISMDVLARAKKQVNSFIIPLLKASYSEKFKFFRMIDDNGSMLLPLLPLMNKLNVFLCKHSSVGFLIVLIIAPIYSFKLFFKHK